MNPTQQRLNRARWWALREARFDGPLAMNLKDVIGNPHGDTACTDGETIYWDEKFVASLDDKELRFVLLHETAHCALGHAWRLPATELGNMAGDYAINAELVRRGLDMKMPASGLLDPRFANMAEESILAILKNEEKDDKNKGKGNGGGMGTFVPAPAAAEPAKLKEKWERAVVQAAQAAAASNAGTLDGGYNRQVSRLTAQASVDWRQETADFLRQSLGQRNDWSRPSRRMAGQPVIYPRKQRDSAGLIIAARDTSGSVNAEQLARFNEAIEQCASELGCEIILMDADTRVRSETRLSCGSPLPVIASGGGGTDFRPVFDRAAELQDEGETIAGIVYVTDLCGPGPESVELPTLWVCTNTRTAATGRTVQLQ